MLFLWTSADAETIKNVVGKVVAKHSVPHQVMPVGDSFPVVTHGDVILAFGTNALLKIQKEGLAPKNRTIGSMRETVINVGLSKCLVTYDPGITYRDYARLPEIQWDVALAIRLHNEKTTKAPLGEYRWVEDFNDLVERIEEKYEQTGKAVEIACDLETLGLDEYNPEAWIISIAFTVDKGKSDMMYFKKGEFPFKSNEPWEVGVWDQINWILTTNKVSTRGANFKYDSRWLNRKWGINPINHKFDTVIVGSLLDENRSNSLKLHAKIYTPMGGYDDEMNKYDKSRMDLVPKPVLLTYGGADTDATYQVASVMKSELLKQNALTNFYVKVAHPGARAFEKMERTGMCVDVPYYMDLKVELEREAKRLEIEMLKMVPDNIKSEFQDDLKITRPALLKKFLFTPAGLNLVPQVLTEKTNQPSTAMDHLMMFEDNKVAAHFIEMFKEYGSTNKTLSTFVVGFLKHLRSDGRFHPTYMMFRGDYAGDDKDAGAVTGRTSAKDPAVQTIPKHTVWTSKLRRAFIAPPGYAILEADYAQGELKIAACLANEPTMLKAYGSGADLHAITAARLNGYTMEQFLALPKAKMKELRSGGKAGNFGLIYGMGATGYKEFARTSYNVKLTDKEAEKQRDAFFELYPGLPEWHDDYKKMAHVHGCVRSPLGRIRHLPLIYSKFSEIRAQAERQSVNSPVQSCLSDMTQLSMVAVGREYPDADIHIFLMTHDSLSAYVRIGEERMWAKRITELMGSLPLKRDFGWDHQIPFTADATISVETDGVHSLANMIEL